MYRNNAILIHVSRQRGLPCQKYGLCSSVIEMELLLPWSGWMSDKNETTDARDILRRRYIAGDPQRETAVDRESINADIAQMIHDLRTEADLTQTELAEAVGTTQSVISRLEGADYDGHSLSMLRRIAGALDRKLAVVMTAAAPAQQNGRLRQAFCTLMRNLRRRAGLSPRELAEKTGVDEAEIRAIERPGAYPPAPDSLRQLSRFYNLSHERLAQLAGAEDEVPARIREEAARYVARSESISDLSGEESVLLDEFVSSLTEEAPEAPQKSCDEQAD